jgi:hypothetical protein
MTAQPAPFKVAIADTVLADLARRLERVVWPDDPANDLRAMFRPMRAMTPG